MADERLFTDDVTDSGFFGSEGGDGAEALDPAVIELVDELLEQAPSGREGLIPVLLGLQQVFDRVSWRVQELVADRFGLSPAQVAGVVGYYPALSAQRRGRLKIEVCTGSACCLQEGERTFEGLRKVEEGQRSKLDDGKLSVRQERCLGVCGLAPAVRVAARIQGPLRANQAMGLVASMLESDSPGEDEV
jgi:NADH:ubiquinone oxidoreductase subunit E